MSFTGENGNSVILRDHCWGDYSLPRCMPFFTIPARPDKKCSIDQDHGSTGFFQYNMA